MELENYYGTMELEIYYGTTELDLGTSSGALRVYVSVGGASISYLRYDCWSEDFHQPMNINYILYCISCCYVLLSFCDE